MEDRELYIKIAHWYYTLGLTQDEIGRRLSMTRQKVNRIINLLPEMGIVTIQVNGFTQGQVADETAIEEHFSINRVIIADNYDNHNFLPSLADTASQHLKEIIHPKAVIGVSWGETLSATISRLPFMNHSNCTVVQMVGAQNIDREMYKSDEIARSLADRLDCVCYNLYAPAILERSATKEMLMQERVIKKSYEMMEKCDIGLFGIGQLNLNSTMHKRGLFQAKDIDALMQAGYVGDICVNPVTIDGDWQNCPIRDRIISANMDILKNIPNVIAIAGGEDKTDAIIACLASGVINTLIIDTDSAQRIIKKCRLQKKTQ